MFFCEPCRVRNEWPESFSRSSGRCEICGQSGPCHDVQSSRLPPARRLKAVRIVKKTEPWQEYRRDCERIVKCFSDRRLMLRPEEAYEIWTMYSESMAAGWMSMRDMTDEQIMFCVQQYYEVLGDYLGEETWISHP